MIRAVLFDLDNTLIDFMKMKRACSEAAVRAMIDSGLKIDEQRGIKILFDMYEKYGMENQSIFDRFIREVHGELDYEMLAKAIIAYRRVKAGHLMPYPNVVRTLIKLKERGLKLGIVSDAPIKQAWLRLAELNLCDFFDVVVARKPGAKAKPHAMPFKKALQQLKLEPAQILFVGDDPSKDILGAKKLGMKTALAKYGQVIYCSKVKADFELEDISDLLGIVDKLNS
ncbi:MAG: HAD-IA family hydrolase [Candidatus Diapherotrites archaeon]|nr:HAD-IA family hydrolase [Candidatus Diapherotrites archaeon]